MPLSWGRCKGCEARSEEIAHLLAIVAELSERANKADARLAEVISPGVVNRASPPLPRPMLQRPERPVRQRITGFPGYEPELEPATVEATEP